MMQMAGLSLSLSASLSLSLCLSCSALSDGWLLVIVCRDQYTVWAFVSPSELMADGSAVIEPQDQYIRPREDAERETLLCLCFKLWMFVPPSVLYFSVGERTSVCWCGCVCSELSSSLHLCFCERITGCESVDTDKSKAPTSPNAHFPSSASSRQRRQIITSLFFCLLSFYSFCSVDPKCCCGGLRD